MDVDVELATARDLPEIWSMYGRVCDAMRGTALDVQWMLGEHPSRGELDDAVLDGGLLVARLEGSVSGAVILNGSCCADYGTVPWRVACAADGAGVLHLMAVDPAARGRGVGDALLRAAARLARERGLEAVRLDTFDFNGPAVRLYERNGFVDRGVFEIEVARHMRHASHMMELAL